MPWYQDILAWPKATVEDGHATYNVVAAVVEGAVRAPFLELACGWESHVNDDAVVVRLTRIAGEPQRGDEFIQHRERLRHRLIDLCTAAELIDGSRSVSYAATILRTQCRRLCADLAELLAGADAELPPEPDNTANDQHCAVRAAVDRLVCALDAQPADLAAVVAALISLGNAFLSQFHSETTGVVPVFSSAEFAPVTEDADPTSL